MISPIVTASVRASEETGLNFIVIRSGKEVTLKPTFKKVDKKIEKADIIIAETIREDPYFSHVEVIQAKIDDKEYKLNFNPI